MGCPSFHYLNLSNTRVTSDGLRHIEGLTQLNELTLGVDGSLMNVGLVTDPGLEHLKGLAQLPMLDLSRLKITDAGLEHLKGLSQLQVLYLNDLKITDSGLTHLGGLKQAPRIISWQFSRHR